ncbi:SCO family protein [Kaistia geumhonensis]|uniref:Protein SCO1/2 n=1 Tax=Kaistia geumhonensis TaxID=410839 RepID=A0ABU0M430_9HYPH|nr:SCO family protein [Kaistia geumhonensis]MCX5479061.1 SCO family protein [Kaistia geumhonensis]MDQ0515719.1 protein SCO1/2 [Kaistia geumhonensis]
MTRKPIPARRPIQVIRLVLWLLVAVAIAGTLALVFLAPGKKMTASAIGGPFSLVDQNGTTVTEAALKGHPSLMFFGYTFCPDVCPTTLLSASNWLKALGPDGDRLKVYFVTVDPERDTVPQMKAYLQAFDPRIVGLTGARDAVDPMLKEFRVYSKKSGEGDDYAMDHSAAVYMLDGNGDFVGTVDYQEDEKTAMEKIRRLLKG